MLVSVRPIDALTILLTAESLLLAVVGLAVSFCAPGGKRVPNLPVPAPVIVWASVIILAIAGIGAGFAWSEIFIPHYPFDFAGFMIAGSIVVAIASEPILAFFLALGTKPKR